MIAIDKNDVNDIQCGSQYTIVLKKDGTMLFCGELDGIVAPSLIPISVMYPIKCIQIACGRKHVLVLGENNIVMSWGRGYFGQLGHGNDNNYTAPKVINSLEPHRLGTKIVQVVCGASHSGALAENGRAFMWGLNKSGQCGILNSKADAVVEPRPVETSSIGSLRGTKLVCGRNHSAMLTTDGRVFVWGAASFGRLGVIDAYKVQTIPTEIPFFRAIPIHSLVSGDFHMLALGHDCSVYSWGYNAEGQCGQGNLFNLKTPRRIDFFDNLQVVSVECGASWSMAVTKSGILYGWGYGDGGWLGIPPSDRLPYVEVDNLTGTGSIEFSQTQAFDSKLNISTPQRVKVLSNKIVEGVRCGGAHTIILSSDKPESMKGNDDKKSDSPAPLSTPVRGYFGTLSPNTSSKYNDSDSKYINSSSDEFEAKERIRSVAENLSMVDPRELTAQLVSWCRHKKIAEISYVLSKGKDYVNINIRDSAGNTPLIVSCQNGHIDIAKMLVESGADVRCSNNKGNTALHFCFAYGYDDLGKYLISKGADEYAVNSDGLTCYEGLTLADIDKI